MSMLPGPVCDVADALAVDRLLGEAPGSAHQRRRAGVYYTVDDIADLLPAVALLNSSLFYWWFILWGDERHLNRREIERFPAGLGRLDEARREALCELDRRLMADLRRHAVRKEACYRAMGLVRYDEFYPRHSKPILDEIDGVLGRHFGLSE